MTVFCGISPVGIGAGLALKEASVWYLKGIESDPFNSQFSGEWRGDTARVPGPGHWKSPLCCLLRDPREGEVEEHQRVRPGHGHEPRLHLHGAAQPAGSELGGRGGGGGDHYDGQQHPPQHHHHTHQLDHEHWQKMNGIWRWVAVAAISKLKKMMIGSVQYHSQDD